MPGRDDGREVGDPLCDCLPIDDFARCVRLADIGDQAHPLGRVRVLELGRCGRALVRCDVVLALLQGQIEGACPAERVDVTDDSSGFVPTRARGKCSHASPRILTAIISPKS